MFSLQASLFTRRIFAAVIVCGRRMLEAPYLGLPRMKLVHWYLYLDPSSTMVGIVYMARFFNFSYLNFAQITFFKVENQSMKIKRISKKITQFQNKSSIQAVQCIIVLLKKTKTFNLFLLQNLSKFLKPFTFINYRIFFNA